MPKKPKPRWGWSETHDGKDMRRRMDRLDFERVARLLGRREEEIGERTWLDLDFAFFAYYNEVYDDSGPTHAEIKAALEELHKRITALEFAWDNMDEYSLRYIDSGMTPMSDEELEEFRALGEPYIEDPFSKELNEMKGYIEVGLGKIPESKPGRKRNRALTDFILRLSYIYENTTQTRAYENFYYDRDYKKYGGPFFIFLEEIFSSLTPDLEITNNALGEAIRRAVGDRVYGKTESL